MAVARNGRQPFFFALGRRGTGPAYALVTLIIGALIFHRWIFRHAPENP